jgi:prepilin-type N-terminal cleavage/methylation domain-containing protein/prepilin-type processing-associated H-X9-DG protein
MRTKKGFTLIELLVVIAIIAILAAILFPVFAKAREKARQTACLNNLKQIGLGMMQYVQDYDENYPRTWNWNGSAYIGPFGVLDPYVKSSKVFVCPSQSNPGQNTYQTFPTSFAFNYLLAWSSLGSCVKPASTVAMCDSGCQATLYSDTTPGVNVNSVQKPGVWILVTPDFGGPAYACSMNADWGGPMLRHSERCNVTFADGHAKSMSASWYYNASPWLDPTIGGN